MKKKGFKSGLVVFIILIVFVTGCALVTLLEPSFLSATINDVHVSKSVTVSSNPEIKVPKEQKKDYIAALYIEGTIEESNYQYNQNWIMTNIDTLKNDDKNKALAIFINSPGGAVYQADEVYLALQDYKTSGKKIYVYQGPMAASGGYYISCAANQIYANRNTLTGSIGVLFGQSVDITELLQNIGIKSETIHSGKNKNMLNYNEPITDEQREIMQSICDECYEQFVSIVVSQRDLTSAQAHKICDGRIYTAKQALNNGLIDKIDSWDNMIKDLSEEIKQPGINVKTFKYQKKQNMVDLMMGKISDIEKNAAASRLGLPVKVLDDINGFNSYPAYLYIPN